jgi:hypothetical protein
MIEIDVDEDHDLEENEELVVGNIIANGQDKSGNSEDEHSEPNGDESVI